MAKKKCVIIKKGEIPILCVAVAELEPLEFVQIQKECNENFARFVSNRQNEKKNLIDEINQLKHRIAVLEGTEDE